MLKTYRTVEQFGQDEVVIEKSTFIGYARPVANEEEALAFIQEIKKSIGMPHTTCRLMCWGNTTISSAAMMTASHRAQQACQCWKC